MLFSLKLQRDNRKNALAVDPAKGKTGKKLYFSPHCGDETTTYYKEPLGKVSPSIATFPFVQGARWGFPFPVFCVLGSCFCALSVWRPRFVLVCKKRGWRGYGRQLPEHVDVFYLALSWRGCFIFTT